MLKITRTDNHGRTQLMLEGRLMQAWVPALQSEVDSCRDVPQLELSLNVAALTFVDAAGAQQLLALEQHGVALAGLSDFLRGLLDSYRR